MGLGRDTNNVANLLFDKVNRVGENQGLNHLSKNRSRYGIVPMEVLQAGKIRQNEGKLPGFLDRTWSTIFSYEYALLFKTREEGL